MRGDGRHPGPRWLLAAALLAGAGPAGAQVYGTAQFQYQNVEDVRSVLLADGTRVLRRSTTEQLVKSIDVRHQSYLRQNLLMDTDLRFAEQSVLGGVERTRTPSGTVRLMHPAFQLTAQHRPSSVRSTSTGAASVADVDTNRVTRTLNTAETMLIGQAAAPGGAKFNASWLSRRREGSLGAPTERSVLRNVRATVDRERYSAYVNAGDQVQKMGQAGTVRSRQGQYGLGGVWRVASAKTASALLQYDFASTRTRPSATYSTTSIMQNALASGEWRPSATLSGSASYNWRRSGTRSLRSTSLTDQEGSILGRWQPVRGAAFTSGGGFRTQRDAAGGARMLEYITAVAAGDGKLRKGWTVNSSLSHTTTWDPERGTFGTQTAGCNTRMILSPRISLDGTLSLVANGDEATSEQRWTNSWTTRLSAQPLRSLTVSGGLRAQRVGPGLLSPISMSRGTTLDALLRPHARVDVQGSYALTELRTDSRVKTRTWASTSRMQLSDRWNLQASWSRTATPRATTSPESPVTHDAASGRLLWQPTRRVAASASLTSTDPGKALETRRVDGTLTWSFGR